MALCHLHWFSKVLGKQVGSFVILPDDGTPPFATMYLLHGLSDDYTIWQRRTRIESYVQGLPLIVVMPDGFRGFYTDNEAGPAYARYIGQELPAMIERNFPARASRAGRCIGGLSMGGYGALRIALGHPERFASAHSHSGALLAGTRGWDEDSEEFRRIFGANPAGSNHDLLALARSARSRGPLPAIRIDCGTDDFLIADNRRFHAELERMGIGHEYEEHAGAHDWDYWDTHIRSALAFHARHLRLGPAS
jgi:S-formylglutathione hydrolase FrmB